MRREGPSRGGGGPRPYWTQRLVGRAPARVLREEARPRRKSEARRRESSPGEVEARRDTFLGDSSPVGTNQERNPVPLFLSPHLFPSSYPPCLDLFSLRLCAFCVFSSNDAPRFDSRPGVLQRHRSVEHQPPRRGVGIDGEVALPLELIEISRRRALEAGVHP